MWFKNLVVYRFTRPFELSAESLQAKLAEAAFHPCRAQEITRQGWSSPMGKLGEQLVYASNGYLLINLRKEEKIIPASVVSDHLTEKVEAIEQEQDRKVRKKERDSLKEEILIDLLPKAFSRFQHTLAFIDPRSGVLVVDASSAKRAEDLCSHLRKTLGSLPVTIPALKQAPNSVMTGWLESEAALPDGFIAGDEAELKEPTDDGSIIRCKNQALFSDEIRAHLDAGKQVAKLALHWRDKLGFLLGEDLIMRRVKFSDTLLDQASDMGQADAAAAFDADFYLMSQEVCSLIPELFDALGGENSESYNAVTV
ncbi:recombination-associated protein RdgC [Motiliproteus sediminis]|uniref:recombination-associated protein RdgC n=1 Tax=Motiliproteus sediminis TaxID=1468178 RepID=UPI001AEFF696|nr:recombination-associated protein RdgC [Motiliproteus sediminis]